MNETDAAMAVVAVLEDLGAEYMISGSFASNLWGSPRQTQDMDIVIDIKSLDLNAFFERIGPDFEIDRQLRFEGVTATHRYVVEHRSTLFRAELFLLTDDPFDQARFARRVGIEFASRKVAFSTAEDTVIQKLRWLHLSGHYKHHDDVLGILRLQRSNLDWDYIRMWSDKLGMRRLLDEIAAELDP
jgi:hypothetical protein